MSYYGEGDAIIQETSVHDINDVFHSQRKKLIDKYKEQDEPKQSVEKAERAQQANLINEHVTTESIHGAKGPLQMYMYLSYFIYQQYNVGAREAFPSLLDQVGLLL